MTTKILDKYLGKGEGSCSVPQFNTCAQTKFYLDGTALQILPSNIDIGYYKPTFVSPIPPKSASKGFALKESSSGFANAIDL